MTRLLILATIILSVISYASAQIVDTLNTPIGPVTQGAKVAVTWALLPGADAGTATGDLSATDSATKNVLSIDPAVPLAPKTYLWNVQVPPGTYTLGLNDGSGLKQSGEVVVKAPAAAPSAPPAKGAPAPAPSATGGSPSTPSTPTGNSSSTPAAVSTGSASSIFPGFDVVLSLLSVAVAMSQF
ncbi:8927_t:CDS:2 [Rhizophagus irregularis]|nr:8927_t:CDS:2 [Rhizophagus irregularis]